jgi:hypothetical protein
MSFGTIRPVRRLTVEVEASVLNLFCVSNMNLSYYWSLVVPLIHILRKLSILFIQSHDCAMITYEYLIYTYYMW